MIPLDGHTTESSAYVVDDYPYGARARCRIRYWLEYGGVAKGWRFVSQTEDPKRLRWNNPKKSTYAPLAAAMFLDDKGHVQWDGVTEYTDAPGVQKFIENFPGANLSLLRAWAKKKVHFYMALAEGRVMHTINGVRQESSERDRERAAHDLADWLRVQEILS